MLLVFHAYREVLHVILVRHLDCGHSRAQTRHLFDVLNLYSGLVIGILVSVLLLFFVVMIVVKPVRVVFDYG